MASDSPELLGDLYIREFPQNLVQIEELLSTSSPYDSSASITAELPRNLMELEDQLLSTPYPYDSSAPITAESPQSLVDLEDQLLSTSYPYDSSASDTFFFTITAKLTRRVADEEGRRSVEFWKSFSMPLDTLVNGGTAACDAVAWMLSEVHVPYWSIGVIQIVERAHRLVNGRRSTHDDDDQTRVLHMEVYIDAFVNELPVPSENDNYDIVNDDFDEIEDDDREAERISFDEYDVRFVPASMEAIESLEKIRVMEKEVTCRVCLDDVSVGSEVTRLPCSHLFHGDCIVKWLQKSKFCPLCRLEISV